MAISNFLGNFSLKLSETCFDLKNQMLIKLNDKITKIREESLQTSQYCKQVLSKYFKRIHKKYSFLNTIHIKKLAQEILQNPSIIPFVREKTLLKDTWFHKFWQTETPLGEVLHELQRSQESPHREILNKDILSKAEKEAVILLDQITKKESIDEFPEFNNMQQLQSINMQANFGQRRLLSTTTNAVKIGEEFQVNTYTSNDQSRSQDGPAVVTLNNGKFIVVWTSYGQDGSSGGIYGQIFNANGIKSGTEFQINTYTTNHQALPSLASLNNGKFVVTWQSYGQDGYWEGIYGQLFTADGIKSGSEFQINTYTTYSQELPSVAALNDGKFVVVWQSDDEAGPVYHAIVYGQLFNADGTRNGSAFQISPDSPYFQGRPSIASLISGKFVVVWGSSTLYGQLFKADRTKSGTEFQINTSPIDSGIWNAVPSIASLDDGKFIVVWGSQGLDGSGYGVYGQLFNGDGTKSGLEFQINTYTTSNQLLPSVAPLNNGKFVVTWESRNQDGSDYGVYGQLFNGDGTKSGLEFQINTYTTNNQALPSVAPVGADKFVVVWGSQGQDGSDYGVYGQNFQLNSFPTIQNPIPNQTIEHNSLFTYTIPVNTFADTDEDMLTYTATQTNDNLLPTWLNFNPITKTFSGIPLNVGSLSVKVTVNDGNGGSVSNDFIISITNTAPVIQNPIPNQTTGHNSLFIYTVPVNTFFDANGDGLTYSATQTNGAPLPEWLSFTPTTRTFSGTPSSGSFSIRVTATDGLGGSVSNDFIISITNIVPILQNPIPNQTIEHNSLFTYTVPVNTFADADGDTLTYIATQTNGDPLPAWLNFNPTTRTFSGTPSSGSFSVRVTATDGLGGSVSNDFIISITNIVPILQNPIPNQTIECNSLFTYTIPADTFSDANGDSLTYTAMQTNGNPLPFWLIFHTTTRTFSGTPSSTDIGSFSVKVTASDNFGGSVSNDFTISITTKDSTPVPEPTNPEEKKFHRILETLETLGIVGGGLAFFVTCYKLVKIYKKFRNRRHP